jgi:hypothetical protein
MLPNVSITIQDGALGQVPPSSARSQFKTGVCSAGIVGTMYTLSDIAAARAALGTGPLTEAVCQQLAVGGGPVYAMPINPSTAGSASAVTHTGPGSGTVAVSFAPAQSIAIKISAGGTLGTATVQISLGGGAYSSPVATTAGPWSYAVPGTMTTITIAAGTYVLNDVYTISTLGVVTLVGSGPSASNVTFASSPLDVYSPLITIVTGGALGTATFTLSMDGGNNTGGLVATPGAGKYALPAAGSLLSGIVVTFASSFTAADTYSFTTTAAGFNGTDVTNAFTTALGLAYRFSLAHLVGMASTSAGAATIAATVDTLMTTAQTAFKYIRCFVECPVTESDSTITTAFASFQSTRVAVVACDVGLISAVDAKIQRRCSSWVVAAHASVVSPDEDLGFVGSNQLIKNVVSIYANGGSTTWDPTTLNDNRFITMRTFPDRPGYYITRGVTMAAYGSDYSRLTNARVMDVACTIVRAALLPYINGSVRVNTTTGFIAETDALVIEAKVNATLRAGMTGLISTKADGSPGADVVLSRTTNLFSTSTEPVSIRIVPKAYFDALAATIGFSNPALSA